MTVQKKWIVFVISLLLSVTAWAQEFPKAEVGLDYSYARFAPNVSGSQGHSLNGGGGTLVYNFNRVQPFVHLLFGGAHSNVYGNAFKNICLVGTGVCSFSKAPSNNTFAMAFGGGVDIPIGHVVAIRPAEIDYLYTNFNNNFNGSNQNNFRYSGGIVFNLGGTSK